VTGAVDYKRSSFYYDRKSFMIQGPHSQDLLRTSYDPLFFVGCIIDKVKRPFYVHLVFLRDPNIKIDPNTIVRSFDNTSQDTGVKRKQILAKVLFLDWRYIKKQTI
jgi:hypothetical protein